MILEPEGKDWTFRPITPDGKSGYLMIPAMGKGIERRLEIKAIESRTSD